MLKLMQGSHSISKFNKAHPALPEPAKDKFFSSNGVDDLQEIVDTTWKMRKKLDFSSPGGMPHAMLARSILQLAESGNLGVVEVRWGIHQHQEIEDTAIGGEPGKMRHFTVKWDPNDWHLYIKSDNSRIAYMSNGPAPANFVKIARY